jgi:hypothetical protein
MTTVASTLATRLARSTTLRIFRLRVTITGTVEICARTGRVHRRLDLPMLGWRLEANLNAREVAFIE